MRQKKILTIFSLILVLGLILAACQPAATEAPAEPTSAPEPTEEMMEEVTLRWRTRPDNQEEANVYQSISNSLDLEGVTLVYEPGGSETASYQDVLKTELASGTTPDVFWIPGTDVADFATTVCCLTCDRLLMAPQATATATSTPAPCST